MSDTRPSEATDGPTVVDAPPLTALLFRFVEPRIYLASIVAGFLLCVAAGWLAGRLHRFDGFVRFHPYINAETLYNVTALQVQRLVETIPRDRIAVIVSGSSRLHGTGMAPDETWSHELQRLLGDRYGVLNLALRSGRMDHFGMHAAEMLARRGRPVIVVGEIVPALILTGVGSYQPYQYFYYDARARGLLYDWPARDEALARATASAGAAARMRLAELARHGEANALLNFDELWNLIGYRYVFLGGWNMRTAQTPWRPRGAYPDLENYSAPPEGYYGRYSPAEQISSVRRWAVPVDPNVLAAVAESVQTIPEVIRARSIVAILGRSPYYLDQLSSEDRSLYERNFEAYLEAYRDAGLNTIRPDRAWDARDFVDSIHMSPRGGAKLAAAMAPLIEQLARQLGYLE